MSESKSREAFAQLLDVLRNTRLARHSRLFQPSGWAEFLKYYVKAVKISALTIKAKKSAAALPYANVSPNDCAEQVTISIDKISRSPTGGSSMGVIWRFTTKGGAIKELLGGLEFERDEEFRGGRQFIAPNNP